MDPTRPEEKARACARGESQPPDVAPSEAAVPQIVRFASVNQEIEPLRSLQPDTKSSDNTTLNSQLSPQQADEIRSLSSNLQNSHLQQSRMFNYAFEPVSLPVSRAPSNDSSAYQSSREPTRSGGPSPKHSPSISALLTPPLTPYGTQPGEGQAKDLPSAGLAKVHADPAKMVPQTAGEDVAAEVPVDGSTYSTATSRYPSASDQASTRPTSVSMESNTADAQQKKAADFIVGPSRSQSSPSPSRSRDESPSHGPRESRSGTATPPTGYGRPFTPSGDRDDPYARSKRPPQSRNLDAIDARFVFGGGDSRRRSGLLGSAAASTGHLPRPNSGRDLKNEHRQSTFSLHTLGGKKDHHEEKHGSMSDLKRFLGFSSHHKSKRNQSPAGSAKSTITTTGTQTPPHLASPANVPFADDHGLQTKWGKFGKILGSGAGGSVRLMKRQSDGTTFAVKQFRDRHGYESERDYNKKVTAEFCIGSTLHHGNIIETLDIVHEKGHWFEVMEYAPFDLFAIVMTGKMSREEIACCFLQIVHGVAFLHGMGLAHRDLKLDNVVVNEHGILKIIDFGSASVFKYPFENDIILASGVVGSDPYLAPEVYDERKYDPQAADIWSLAIIFACMSLRRFPWKAPRLTDNSYKLFVSPPSPTPAAEPAARERTESATDIIPAGADERRSSAPAHHSHPHTHHHHHDRASEGSHAPGTEHAVSDVAQPKAEAPKQEVIKGSWRLLRLLPRETRSTIGRMLIVNPKERATLDDVLADPWVQGSPVCEQLTGGQVVRAGTHVHTLEPGTPTPVANGKQG